MRGGEIELDVGGIDEVDADVTLFELVLLGCGGCWSHGEPLTTREYVM